MSYLRPIAGECVWYCLPLLCSHQPSAVSELALVTVRALHALDPAHTGTILQAIAYNSGSDKDSKDKGVQQNKERAATIAAADTCSTRARASWLAVVTEPRLVHSLARLR